MVQKTETQRRQIEGFSAYLNKLCEAVSAYPKQMAVYSLEQIRTEFIKKADDLYRENRNFQFAVIGQVKAGKSSFLNTLLFDGTPVLPRARTPKTSVLTRIEYGERNELSVEYISQEEWANLLCLAKTQLITPQSRAARDLAELAKAVCTPLERCFATKSETFYFDRYTELTERLNDYISEDGVYTPAVKSLVLRLASDNLKGITVVDTPGLNDPLYSRTEQTRQYLEICDAAFLLSRCGCFLDANDLRLLALQLPQKGIGSVVLVGSQFDSALIDTLPDFSTLEKAVTATAGALRTHARAAVEESVRSLRREGFPPAVLKVIERCGKPVFVSAMMEDVLRKSTPDYTEQETLVLKQLSLCGAPTGEQLTQISNFGEVTALFNELLLQKDALLQRKAESLVLFVQSELKLLLTGLYGSAKEELSTTSARLDAVKKRADELAEQLNNTRGTVDTVFEEYLSPLDETLSKILLDLRDLQKDWAEPEMKENFEVHTLTRQVSAARPILPWTWGKQRTEYYNQKAVYTYLDADEIRQNLRLLDQLTARLQQEAFARFADTQHLAAGLYKAAQKCCAQEHLAGISERINETLTVVLARIPAFHPSGLEQAQDLLLLPVKGEVRDPAVQSRLCEASSIAAAQILVGCRAAAGRYASLLRSVAQGASADITAVLCKKLFKEQRSLLKEQNELREALAPQQEFCELLSRYV